MPNHTYKSAAVPFVNQKGERSMKRVKVERYVAGKKPGYAKDDDEDDEYYTTDDEEDHSELDEEFDDEEGEGSDTKTDDDSKPQDPSTSTLVSKIQKGSIILNILDRKSVKPSILEQNNDDNEIDDDPRFRRLRQLEKSRKTSSDDPQASSSRALPKIQPRIVLVDEHDEEEDDEIRKRHSLARARQLEKPIGPQTILGNLNSDSLLDGSHLDNDEDHSRRIQRGQDAEDILNDLTFEGFRPKNRKAKNAEEAENKLKDMLEKAKEEAIFTAQLHKKIEEDNRKELEKEALNKEGIGAADMEAVRTDDEDEELAYEEWKLREIKRVLRDRSERFLKTKAR